MHAVADKPANGDDLSRAHQLAVVHNTGKQADRHQPYRFQLRRSQVAAGGKVDGDLAHRYPRRARKCNGIKKTRALGSNLAEAPRGRGREGRRRVYFGKRTEISLRSAHGGTPARRDMICLDKTQT